MSTVLVVDDDPTVVAVVRQQLTTLGHEVLAASHPAKALDLVENGPREPELAVLDISMPEMTGFELAQILHMREETSRLPVIFLSATVEQEAHFEDDGVRAAYVTKSAIGERLPTVVTDMLPPQPGD